MADKFGIAYRLRIFTLRELIEAVMESNPLQTSKLLQRWQQQGMVVQVRRNLYCMVDLATGLPICNKYEIGSHLSESSYISYHSALEFHGLAHQPFNEVFVSSQSRFNSFCYDDVDYTYCRQTATNIKGVGSPKGNPFVRVTDIERTLLDCFDRIDRAGGIEELVHCMEGVVLIDEGKLVAYLAAFNKAFLYQKTGYLLERIKEQAHISDSLIELCREKGTKSVKWLTNNDESDTFVNRWRLYVPQVLTQKEMEYELI
jgi:predicted transcriptional regulator of viral defense system